MELRTLDGCGWQELKGEETTLILFGVMTEIQIFGLWTNYSLTTEVPQTLYDTLYTHRKPSRRTEHVYVPHEIRASLEADVWRPRRQISPVDTAAIITRRPQGPLSKIDSPRGTNVAPVPGSGSEMRTSAELRIVVPSPH